MEEKNIEIPEKFYSYSTGAPFERCLECDKYLLDDDTEYFIEKAMKTYEGFAAQDVVFEYALCIDCVERMRKTMSKESLQQIDDYFKTRVDVLSRMEVVQTHPHNPDAWTAQCLVKGVGTQEMTEYQIYAHCNGRHLNMTHMPYMISGQALDEIAHLLSEETLDELDGFISRHFGPPPELAEPLPKRRFVLV